MGIALPGFQGIVPSGGVQWSCTSKSLHSWGTDTDTAIDCLCPLKFICWLLTPKVMVSGGGAFGSWWGYEGGGPRMDQWPIKESTPLPQPFLQVRTQWEDIVCEPGRALTIHRGRCHLDLRLLPSRAMWNLYLLFVRPTLFYLSQQLEWTGTESNGWGSHRIQVRVSEKVNRGFWRVIRFQ